MKILSILLMITIIGAACGQEEGSEVDGDFRTAAIGDWFQYYIYQPDADQVSTRIRQVIRKEDPKLPSDELAEMISLVSTCYHIDAFFFTGMIQMESWFDSQAKSPTNAVGLTQFTSIGIKEVNDQLGKRGHRYARRSATRYHERVIRECIMPNANKTWEPIWLDDTLSMKQSLLAKPLYALIYGAILLKTNLAVAKKIHQDSGRSLSAKALFKTALWRYNGDPSEVVRQRYVNRILKYAAEFHRAARLN